MLTYWLIWTPNVVWSTFDGMLVLPLSLVALTDVWQPQFSLINDIIFLCESAKGNECARLFGSWQAAIPLTELGARAVSALITLVGNFDAYLPRTQLCWKQRVFPSKKQSFRPTLLLIIICDKVGSSALDWLDREKNWTRRTTQHTRKSNRLIKLMTARNPVMNILLTVNSHNESNKKKTRHSGSHCQPRRAVGYCVDRRCRLGPVWLDFCSFHGSSPFMAFSACIQSCRPCLP